MTPRPKGSLELVVGPAGSGKTAAALAEYREFLAKRQAAWVRGAAADADSAGDLARCVWIAPVGPVAADVREALVDPRAGAVLDPGITTFARLAAECVAEAGLRVRPITRLQRQRLLGRLIADAAAAGRIPYFAAVAQSPGLVSVVDDAIAECQRRGIAPQDVPGDADGPEDPRVRDLAELYARYAERLAAGRLVDDAGLVSEAATALAAAPQTAANLGLVVIDGFAHFSAGELALIGQLRARAQRVVVTLPADAAGAAPRTELMARPAAAAAQLVRMGAKVHAAAPAVGAWPALAHLERNLFRSVRQLEPVTPAVAASLDRIHVVAASGVQAEICEIARRVKQRLLAGVAPGNIVVAFRSTRDVADRVRQVFDDFGIPTALDAPRRLAAAPLVRSLISVLRLAAEDWPYRRVLCVAGDRSLRLFDEPERARTAIELCVRHAQLPRGRAALVKQIEHWSNLAAADAEPTSATATTALAALRELAGALGKLPQKKAKLQRWQNALGALANHLGLLRPATGDDPADWAILEQSLRAAGQIDRWAGFGEQELSLAELVDLAAATAAQVPGAEKRDAAGRVRVLSARQARFTRPRHLFVCGLSEQAFPAVRPASMAEDAPAVDDARSAEMLLFYQLVCRPTESLTLSYAALDERGQAMPASPFLAELERAFGDAKIGRTVQPLDAGRREEGAATPLSRSALRRGAAARALDGDRSLLAALVADSGWDGLGGPPAQACVAATSHAHADEGMAHGVDVGRAILAGIEAIAERGRRDEFGVFEGLLTSPESAARLRERFGGDHLWSPSQLETYAACPFVFFGQQTLNLQPLPELALESDMARRGAVLHETLAQLYAQLRGAALDPAQVADVMERQFHDILAAVVRARPGRGLEAALREIERRQIAAWAQGFAQQDAAYRAQWLTMDHPPQPAHFEVRFGPARRARDGEAADPLSCNDPFALPVTIDGAEERVQIVGQIDRIDMGRVGDRTVFNVVDYKSGKSHPVKPEEIAAGRQLQLPLYALAVEGLLLKEQNAAPLSAGYWSVQGKGFSRGDHSGRGASALEINRYRQGDLEPAPDWKLTRAALESRIGQIVAAIRRGQFPVFNEQEDCTTFCELRTICRIAHIRSLEKQWPTNAMTKAQK